MGSTTTSTLGLSVPAAPFELPASFLCRTAWANGFETGDEFCSITGLARNHVIDVPDAFAETLGSWTRHPASVFERFSMAGGKIIPFGFSSVKGTQLQKKGTRYCPHCLYEDAARGDTTPRSGYIRGPWHWRMISHFPEHGCLLAQDQIGLLHLENYESLVATKDILEAAEPNASDRYFYDRLTTPAGSGYLDQFPAYVGAEFCALLGQFQKALRTGSLNERIAGGFESYEVRRDGFAIAAQGRSAIWEFLAEYVSDASRRITLPRRIYSPFLWWWATNKHNADYKELFSLFQQHAEEHVALEPGEAFVTVISKRRVYSLTGAAIQYGLSKERARHVLQTKMGTKNIPHFLRRDDIHHWLLEAASYVPTSGVATVLGCSMNVCDDLIKGGLIATVPNRDYDGRVYRLVHKLEIDNFIRRLESVVKRDLDTTEMVSASIIFKICKCRIVDILALAFAGKLSRIGLVGPDIRISGLFFDPAEIRREIAASRKLNPNKGFDNDLIDLRAARLRLGIKKLAMEGLVESGLIPSVEVESGNNWDGYARKMVRVDDLDAFAELHVSLDELIEKTRIERAVLLADLKEMAIIPVFDSNKLTSKIYRKTDIEAAGFL